MVKRLVVSNHICIISAQSCTEDFSKCLYKVDSWQIPLYFLHSSLLSLAYWDHLSYSSLRRNSLLRPHCLHKFLNPLMDVFSRCCKSARAPSQLPGFYFSPYLHLKFTSFHVGSPFTSEAIWPVPQTVIILCPTFQNFPEALSEIRHPHFWSWLFLVCIHSLTSLLPGIVLELFQFVWSALSLPTLFRLIISSYL